MGILTTAANKRNLDALHDRYYGGPGIWPAPRTSAGAYVDENTALGISTVFSCVLQLSQAISTLPLLTYERLDNGGKQRAPKHPLFKMLHSKFNKETTSTAARGAMGAWYWLWGNAYAHIERSKGLTGPKAIKALWVLPSDTMSVQRGRNVAYGADPQPDDPALWYYNSAFPNGPNDARPREFKANEILHIPGFGFDGIKGLSRIALARRTLGLTVDAEEMGSAFFANGMNLDCTLEHPGKFSQAAHDNIMKSVIEPSQGRKGAGGPLLLWEGMKMQKLTMPLKDAQFLELRGFQTAEVCRFFNMPLHKAKNMAAATWGNVEQENIGYVVDTLRPEFVGWEQAINLKLFEGDDKYFCEFLVDGLLRGDKLTRTQACQLEHNNGNLTNDEWREIENRNPCEDGKGGKRYIPAFLVEADAPPPPPAPVQPKQPAISEPIPPEQQPVAKKELPEGVKLVRARLAASFGLVLQDAAERVVKREVADARKALGKDFKGWLDTYYADNGPFAEYFARSFGPVVRAYGDQVVEYALMETGKEAKSITADREAHAVEYLREMWAAFREYSIKAYVGDDIPSLLDEWAKTRAIQITEHEKTAIADSFSELVYRTMGGK